MMTSAITFSLLSLFIAGDAQTVNVSGQIILPNKTLDVTMMIPVVTASCEPNFQKLQHKIKYYNSSGKKIALQPDEIEEIKFSYNGKDIRMQSRPNSVESGNFLSSGRRILLKLEVDGKLKMFNYYYTQSSPGVYNPASRVRTGVFNQTTTQGILEKDGVLKQPNKKNFKKDMSNYFSDCPLLAQKIAGNELSEENLIEIVELYNTNCDQ
ncbi:MAG: hypothetical protein RIA63_10085 [Cyclobacteriaceae bacterium]